MSQKVKDAYPVILLTLVVAVSMTLLTMTDSITRDEIAKRKDEELKDMLGEQFTDMDDFEYNEDIEIYIIKDAANSTIGYAFLAIGQGYGGDIELLVGLENESCIKDVSVITHSETPGLGAKITEPWFTQQFKGATIDDLALKKDGGQIDAISGATISSTAVVKTIKETAVKKVKQLKELEEEK